MKRFKLFMKARKMSAIKSARYSKKRPIISRKGAKAQRNSWRLCAFAVKLSHFHGSKTLYFVQLHPELAEHKIVHPVFNEISVTVIGQEYREVKDRLDK